MRLFPAAASFDTLSERHGGRYKWFVLLVVAMGIVAGVLSTSSFNVAVPALTRHFGLGHGSGAHAPNEYYVIESSNPAVKGMADATLSYVMHLYALAAL